MPDHLATVIAALIGALSGSFTAIFAEHWLKRADEVRLAEEKLLDRYLLQFQDAVESLWHRLHNVHSRGGRRVMSESYYEVSTLYALGRVLAYDRILQLDGVYLQLKRLRKFDPELGPSLKDMLRRMDNNLDEGKFQRYHRLALAEAVTERDTGMMRTRGYMDFKHLYEAPDSQVRESLAPAKGFVETASKLMLVNLMNDLEKIVILLSKTTQIAATVDDFQSSAQPSSSE